MNTLDFEMFDPVEAGEEWAVDFGSPHLVVESIIDGRRLIDIIHEIEAPQKAGEGGLDYGHTSPRRLYGDLVNARLNDGYFPNDVYLFVCYSCGEIGCNSVTCHVIEVGDYVFWTDFENRCDYGGLYFQFEKKQYDAAMEKLKWMAEHQDRPGYVRYADRMRYLPKGGTDDFRS